MRMNSLYRQDNRIYTLLTITSFCSSLLFDNHPSLLPFDLLDPIAANDDDIGGCGV